MSDEAAIMIRADGPYLVSGSVPLRRRTKIETDEGEPIAWRSGPVVHDGAMYALCRCGASAHKPFCDSSHADVGFDGTETADAGTYAERAKSLGGTEIEIFDDRSICSHAGFCGTAATNIWKMAGDTADTVVRSQAVAGSPSPAPMVRPSRPATGWRCAGAGVAPTSRSATAHTGTRSSGTLSTDR